MKMLLLLFSFSLVSCITANKDGAEQNVERDAKTESQERADAEISVSGNFQTQTLSLSNNPLTSRRIDRRQASALAGRIESAIKSSKSSDVREYIALMSARRISGEDLGKIMEVARLMVAQEMKKDINRGLPEVAKIELILAAIQSRKYSYAEYFIDSVKNSKNKRIQAAALTASGLIAANDERLPEAMDIWNRVLQIDDKYEPALFNIGFTALKYGDFARAKRTLGQLSNDWFASYGLISVERHTKENGRADSLCQRILQSRSNYKPAIFNCAVHYHEGGNRSGEALALLDKMTKVPGYPEWDEKAYKLKAEIEREAAAQRRAASSSSAAGQKASQQKSENNNNSTGQSAESKADEK